MRLTDLFHLSSNDIPEESEIPLTFGEALTAAFHILCHGDAAVTQAIADCLADTRAYCRQRKDAFDERGLVYDEAAEPWLQLIAAVDAALEGQYLCELDYKENAEEFAANLEGILHTNHLTFSLERLAFDGDKNIPDWVAQFNEYAGQSGITVFGIDIDSDSFVLGAAQIGDYALAADVAGEAGIHINCRLN